jgi:ankyrin repeat protein
VIGLGLAISGAGMGVAHAVTDTLPGQNMKLPDNAIIEAAREGDVAGIRDAIMSGIPADDGGIDFVPAIVVATDYNHLDAVKYLLKRGANPNRKARDGRTALAVAAQAGRSSIATVLLDNGADPDLVAENGDTPLFIAVRAHRTSIVQLLLAHNASVEDTDVTGRTALDLAQEHNFDDIAALLRAAESRGSGG